MTGRLPLRGLVALWVLCLVFASQACAATPPSLADAKSQLAAAEAKLAPLERNVLTTREGFRKAYEAVAALSLTPAQARDAADDKLDALPANVRAALESARPAAAAHDANLEAYFAAYDDVATLRMDVKALEVLETLDQTRKNLVGLVGEPALKKLDQATAKVRACADEYWAARDVTAGRKSYQRYMAMRKMSEAGRQAEREIGRIDRSRGATQSPTMKERFRAAMDRARRSWQKLHLATSTNLPLARIVTYLANPLSRKDPDKVSTLLKGMGKSYVSNARIQLDVVGRENVPSSRKLIVTPSHRHAVVDPFSMMSLLEGPVTVLQTILWFPEWARDSVKKLLDEEPGIILAHTDGIDVVGRCAEAVRQGRTLLFFPEGNIPSPLGEIRRMRSGLEAIAQRLLDEPVSIVPVTLDDPADAWGQAPFGSSERDLGMKIRIVFDKPIDPRVVLALSGSRSRLLVDMLRETYHKNLIPSLADPAPARTSPETFTGQLSDPRSRYSEIDPE